MGARGPQGSFWRRGAFREEGWTRSPVCHPLPPSQRSRPGRPRRLSPRGLRNVDAYKPWVSSWEKPEMSDL